MSWTTLGKRRTRGFSDARFGKRSVGAGFLPVARIAGSSRMRPWRTPRYGSGPFRSGGFYGASVRSAVERKVVDTTAAVYQANATGSVTLLNGIATGTDYTNRIGRRVNIVAIQGRGLLFPETAALAGPQAVRCLIIEDMQTNGVIATPSDIFNELSPFTFLNLNNRERFKVHWDKQYVFGSSSTTATQTYSVPPQTHQFNVYKKVNIPMVFEGTAATIGSVSSGALYFVTLGSVVAGTQDVNVAAAFRVRFIDA